MMSTADRQQQGIAALQTPPRDLPPMASAAYWRTKLTKAPEWWSKVFAEPFVKDKADG